MNGEIVVLGLLLGAVAIGALRYRNRDRLRRRRESLHRGDNGLWYWVEFDGREKSSTTHPDERGGAWHEGHAGTNGGGGGFGGGHFGGGSDGDGGGGD